VSSLRRSTFSFVVVFVVDVVFVVVVVANIFKLILLVLQISTNTTQMHCN